MSESPNITYIFAATASAPLFDRGFTGHEHVADFGLINKKFALSESRAKFYLGYAERCKLGKANGRLYDPMLGRSNGNAFNTDLSEGDFSPIYDVNGKFLGTIKGWSGADLRWNRRR